MFSLKSCKNTVYCVRIYMSKSTYTLSVHIHINGNKIKTHDSSYLLDRGYFLSCDEYVIAHYYASYLCESLCAWLNDFIINFKSNEIYF